MATKKSTTTKKKSSNKSSPVTTKKVMKSAKKMAKKRIMSKLSSSYRVCCPVISVSAISSLIPEVKNKQLAGILRMEGFGTLFIVEEDLLLCVDLDN